MGWGHPVKHWTRLYLFLQLGETNSDSAFCVKDPSLNGGYGYGGVLRKQQIVRANQAVEAEAGLVYKKSLPFFSMRCLYHQTEKRSAIDLRDVL